VKELCEKGEYTNHSGKGVVVVFVLLERVMVINVTVNNISIIAWRSVVRKPSVCHMLLTN
jgi:hypothetical protein